MAKETQNLVDLVEPQRGLALLQIAYKPHPHSSPIGKIMLGHSHSFALGLYKLNQWIIHWNTRSSINLFQTPLLYPNGFYNFYFRNNKSDRV